MTTSVAVLMRGGRREKEIHLNIFSGFTFELKFDLNISADAKLFPAYLRA